MCQPCKSDTDKSLCYADGGVVFTAGNVYPQFRNTEREVTIAEDPDDSLPVLNRLVFRPFIIKDNQKVDVNFFKLRAVPEEGLDYYYLDRKGQCRCLSCPNKVTSRCGLVQTRSMQVILLEQLLILTTLDPVNTYDSGHC